jgi:hypothetical protein
MTTDTLTLVYPYYNNGSMLERQLDAWARYADPARWQAIIVDDGSRDDPAQPHLRDVGFPLALYRIREDIPWNQDGARNLAMYHAHGWCLLSDMDHLLPPEQATRLLTVAKDPERYYTLDRQLSDGRPLRRAPNILLLHCDLFARVGGYDEAYSGYYGSDVAFRRRLAERARGGHLPIPLTVYVPAEVPDAATRHYGRRHSPYWLGSNPELARRLAANPPPIKPLNFTWERRQ